MATNYERGRAFEYRTRDKLKEWGAGYVMRAAGSHTKADLIALWPQESLEVVGMPVSAGERPWLVQCKRDGKLPKSEAQELLGIAEAVGALAWMARAGKNGRGVVFEQLTKEVT